jgi:hypothetical protein
MNGGGVDVFFAREEQLWDNCSTIVANVVMQVAYSDKCEWLSDPDTGYSVRDAYHLFHFIQERHLPTSISSGISLCHKRSLLLFGGLSMTGYQQS